MKRQIVLTIDCEDERCGECIYYSSEDFTASGGGFYDSCGLLNTDRLDCIRGPLCLAAEARLTALVEAGEGIAEGWGTSDPGVGINDIEDWDRAVKEVRG